MVAIELYGLRWARALAAAGLVSPDRNRSGFNAHPCAGMIHRSIGRSGDATRGEETQ